MRDLETSKSYKVERRTPEEEDEYGKVRKRVESKQPERIEEDINNEILGSLIYKKILKEYGLRPKRSKDNSSLNPKEILYLALGAIVIAFILYRMLGSGDGYDFKGGDEGAGERGDRPSFRDGSTFENVSYFGKGDLMVQVTSQVTKIVNLMKTGSDKELQKSIETTQRNFLFHGPPGTGKTLFMKKLIYLVDLNLKFLRMKNELGEEKFEKMDHNEKLLRAKEMESLTRITFVTPSSLNNKYVGETEKNIRSLFESADDTKYWASFVFIDEVDVFFSKRSDRSHDYTLKAQTEFLNIIGGACDRLRSSVFLFGATNLYDVLDDAFKRRFSAVYEFSLPNEEERLEILEQYLNECGKDVTSKYNELIRMTNGMAQSKIVDILKKLSFSNDGKMNNIGWGELRKVFEDADPSKKGADGNLVDVTESMKKFYFLEPRPKPKDKREE